MTELNASSLDAIRAKGARIFDPDFFGMYSFEYAYRLLLVFLSTQRTSIQAIRMNNPKAFDHLFEDDIGNAIHSVTEYMDISLSRDRLLSLRDIANDSLVHYIKSQDLSYPGEVAKAVARSMDEQCIESAMTDNGHVIRRIFTEDA